MNADFQHLLVVDTDRGVRTIILNRPERLNAVNARLAAEFPRAMADAAADDAVRVVVIAGAGRAFCSGLDLQDPARPSGDTRGERLDDLAWVGRWVLAVTGCDKPVVAAVHGAAAGAGLGLALACDIRLLSSSAKLTTGYVRRGLSPDAGVSWMLPRLIGQSRAAELILTARDVDAREALAIGLATHVYDDDPFPDEVAAYADSLARGAPIAMALAKRLIHQSADTPLVPHLRNELTSIKQAFQTRDVAEAMQAFVQKRSPTFRGE
ncbi:MAG: enoyl-CoA hydratase/isomerase family protein [Gemmatimonadetes bacterium]|nr:enoyl-CoA hydratase/isomerase family protein [Gemmatimonadota bacterium]